jgi:predicted transcriptional regulator
VIGIVGPEDSVALALRVAAEIGLADSIIARTYDVADQAPGLARELDAVCQVVLFTGRVPYIFTVATGEHRAQLDCVAHSGIDLYRSLVLLLRTFDGHLPALSIDTIEGEVVAEVWRDLSLEPPTTVLPLTSEGESTTARSTDDIVTFHLDAWRSGTVEACLTCLRSVYDQLVRQGVPVFRVEHTRAAIRDALNRARQTLQTVQVEAQQIALGLLELLPNTDPAATGGPPQERYEPEPFAVARKHLVSLLHGRVQEVDERTLMLFTTWGTLQNVLNRPGSGAELMPADLRSGVALGFGLGATLPRAEENARRAVALARVDRTTCVVFTDGTVHRLDDDRPGRTITLRQTDPRTLELARALDMSPTSFQRLAAALQNLDTRALTAQDLAEALRVSVRSARRTLLKLEQGGVVTRNGSATGPGAGRPQTLFKVELEKLLPDT